MNRPNPPPPNVACHFAELSHAAVLPSGPHAGKVLLWHLPVDGNCMYRGLTLTWLFDPALQDPANPRLIEIRQPLETDIFCSGLSFSSAEGALVVVGGSLGANPCAVPNPIPEQSYRFRPNTLAPQILYDPYPYIPLNPTDLPWKRIGDLAFRTYYPGLIHLDRSTVYYSADATAPLGPPQPSCTPDSAIGTSLGFVVGGPALWPTCFIPGDPLNRRYGVQGNWGWQFLDPTSDAWSCVLRPPVAPVDYEEPNAAPFNDASGTGNPGHWDNHDRYEIPVPQAQAPDVLFDTYQRMWQFSTRQVFVAGDVDAAPIDQTLVLLWPGKSVNTPGASWFVDFRLSTMGQPDHCELRRGPFQNLNWPPPADPSNDRGYGSAVLMHMLLIEGGTKDRVLFFGGSFDNAYFGQPVAEDWQVHDSVVELVLGPSPPLTAVWVQKAPMEKRRVFHNAVLLPTGEILIVGGSEADMLPHPGQSPIAAAPVFEPELYDPGRNAGELGSSRLLYPGFAAPPELVIPPTGGGPVPDPTPYPRLYHSLAVLLPDGRVASIGGEPAPGFPNSQYSGEIFSPPYLFTGFRPVITQCPDALAFNGVPFTVKASIKQGNTVPDDGGVVLLRPAALTHHFDADQRLIELAFTKSIVTVGNKTVATLTVTPPTDNLGPAGHYMLFVIEEGPGICHPQSTDRAPSVARFVKLD